MKILQVHISDSERRGGGGGIAMFRLHHSLQSLAVDSHILCGTKTSSQSGVSELPGSALERLVRPLTLRLGLNDVHRLGSFRVVKSRIFQECDLVHFHGTHSGGFSYLALPQIARRRPVVFTLHDMWALSGHCAYSYDCERWKAGCGRCPYPESPPGVRRDATHLEWKLKQWAYRRSRPTFVSPSLWLRDLAAAGLPGPFPLWHIPNGIDTDVFRPLDPHHCRRILGIPSSRRVLMFCATNLKDHRKGGDLLRQVLSGLDGALKQEMTLLLLGDSGAGLEIPGLQSLPIGYLSHDGLKALCYSAADLFVHPTRADNLPLVLQESMACGTPLVSFRVGGVPELVRPGITGRLAEPGDAEGMRKHIVELLEDGNLRRRMSENCRRVALDEYTLDRWARRHFELYDRLLNGRN